MKRTIDFFNLKAFICLTLLFFILSFCIPKNETVQKIPSLGMVHLLFEHPQKKNIKQGAAALEGSQAYFESISR